MAYRPPIPHYWTGQAINSMHLRISTKYALASDIIERVTQLHFRWKTFILFRVFNWSRLFSNWMLEWSLTVHVESSREHNKSTAFLISAMPARWRACSPKAGNGKLVGNQFVQCFSASDCLLSGIRIFKALRKFYSIIHFLIFWAALPARVAVNGGDLYT